MMIGNCCLTNKFEKDVCFGEALLRKTNRAGAVAYIGGTNYTYWGEELPADYVCPVCGHPAEDFEPIYG